MHSSFTSLLVDLSKHVARPAIVHRRCAPCHRAPSLSTYSASFPRPKAVVLLCQVRPGMLISYTWDIWHFDTSSTCPPLCSFSLHCVAFCRYGIKYPQMYAEASHPNAMVFNCYQRAHQVMMVYWSTCRRGFTVSHSFRNVDVMLWAQARTASLYCNSYVPRQLYACAALLYIPQQLSTHVRHCCTSL